MLDMAFWPGNINSVGETWGKNKQACLIYLFLHSLIYSFYFCLLPDLHKMVCYCWCCIFTKCTFFNTSNGNWISLKFLESLIDPIQARYFTSQNNY